MALLSSLSIRVLFLWLPCALIGFNFLITFKISFFENLTVLHTYSYVAKAEGEFEFHFLKENID